MSIRRKREAPSSEEEVSFGSLDFVYANEIVGFLEPLDLLSCLYVCKTMRRGAARTLNAFDLQTKFHQEMFTEWLDNPNLNGPNRVFQEEMSVQAASGNLAGPRRLSRIKELSGELKRRFVVLTYQKKSYNQEQSQVAILDRSGKFVSIYKFRTVQYYEGYVDKRVLNAEGRVFNSKGGSNHGTAEMEFKNSGQLRPGIEAFANALDVRGCQTEWYWQEGFLGNVSDSNYELFRSFENVLSPTEVSTVLMHALSQDTRAIYTYVETVFDHFGWYMNTWEDFFEHVEDMEEETAMIKTWRDRLQSLEYS